MAESENIREVVEAVCRYKVGQKLWYVCKRSTKVECPLCEGQGTVAVKGKSKRCSECRGKGEVTRDKRCVAPFEVREIRLIYGGGGRTRTMEPSYTAHSVTGPGVLRYATALYRTEHEAEAAIKGVT